MLPPPPKNRLAVAPLLPHNCVFHFMPSLILITKVVSPALLSRSTSSAASLTPPPSKYEDPNLIFHSWKCPKCNYTNYRDISHAVFCTNHNKEDEDIGANKCVICHSLNQVYKWMQCPRVSTSPSDEFMLLGGCLLE
jgi:hypothetical protein